MKATGLLLLSTISVGLALPSSSLALVIHVPADQPTFQQGINAAQPGDMVLVAAGTYSGPNNQDLDFLGKDIAVVSEAGPQSTIIDPIPDGQGLGRGFYLHSNETQDALIEGFTIQGGTGPSSGGVFLHFASPTLRNCVFTGNESSGLEVRGDINQPGGPFPFVTLEDCVFTENSDCGLHFFAASGAIRDCQFTANNGWGIILDIGFFGAGPVNHLFERCTISANTAGGIIQTVQGAPTFMDCVISDHPAGSGPGMLDGSEHGSSKFYRCTFRRNLSGGYRLSGSDVRGPYFEDCTFEENSGTYGGAIFLSHQLTTDPVDVQRCRFINNSATQTGGAIGLSEGIVVIENSVFWNNVASVQGGAVGVRIPGGALVTLRSCTIAGGGAPQGGGISSDRPRFTFDRTIIAFTGPGPAVHCGPLIPTIAANCTDIFGNVGGDWVDCMAGLNGANGNISADPRFCELAVGNLNLADDSPCAPAHSGGCGLIGALPVMCGVTAVEPATWGKIKAGFR